MFVIHAIDQLMLFLFKIILIVLYSVWSTGNEDTSS